MDPLIVARVRRPHGVRGEVLVSVDTDRPAQVFTRGRTFHLGNAEGDPVGRQVVLRRMRPTTGAAILQFEGVDDRTGVDALRGHTILIDRTEAAPPAEDEVHYRDLLGLRAFAEERELGEVADLLELPMGQLLVIRPEAGKEVLVPMVGPMIEAVDVAAGVIRLKLPDGFLEI